MRSSADPHVCAVRELAGDILTQHWPRKNAVGPLDPAVTPVCRFCHATLKRTRTGSPGNGWVRVLYVISEEP